MRGRVLLGGGGSLFAVRVIMKQQRPKVTCPECGGYGEVDMPEPYWQVLGILRAGGGRTAGELAEKIGNGIRVTAVNNRLEWLRAAGFVRREREGRNWRYYDGKEKDGAG